MVEIHIASITLIGLFACFVGCLLGLWVKWSFEMYKEKLLRDSKSKEVLGSQVKCTSISNSIFENPIRILIKTEKASETSKEIEAPLPEAERKLSTDGAWFEAKLEPVDKK